MTNNPTADAINAGNKLKSSGVLDLMNMDIADGTLPPVIKVGEVRVSDITQKERTK